MGELIILTGYMIVLAIGGFIADYIFPHIRSEEHTSELQSPS